MLSFRSDFLAEVESWEKRAFLPRRGSLYLVAMSRERAIEAVDALFAAPLAPGMVIVDFLLEQQDRQSPARVTDIEPVLLSLCCYQLNRRRQSGTKIDAALLDTVGEGILKGFYDEALEGEAKRVRKFIEDNLIQGEQGPVAVTRATAPWRAVSSPWRSSTRLERRRLLRIDPQGGEPRIELIDDRLVSVVREARDARRAEERRLQEQEESEKKVKDALAAKQLADSESERRRLDRWRTALGLAVVLMTAALVTAGYFWNQARLESQNVLAERKALEETAVLLNLDLEAAKQGLAKTEAALAGVERSLAELQVLRAAESGGKASRASVDSAKARLDEAKAKQEEIQQKDVETREAKSAGRLAVSGWRLNSGGCTKGPFSVSGTARFSIEPRGNDVLVSEEFQVNGNGFEVVVANSATFPKLSASAQPNQRYYDLNTKVEWKRGGKAEFSTKGIESVYVDENGYPDAGEPHQNQYHLRPPVK